MNRRHSSELVGALLVALPLCIGCSDYDVDYGVNFALVGIHVAQPASNVYSIPAGEIGLVEITSVQLNKKDIDADVCVDLTAAYGLFTCPGASCAMAFDGEDGSATNLTHGSHRIFQNIPVGHAFQIAWPIYRAPTNVDADEISGDAYMSSCANVLDPNTRLTGTNHLEIVVAASLDMSVEGMPSDMSTATPSD